MPFGNMTQPMASMAKQAKQKHVVIVVVVLVVVTTCDFVTKFTHSVYF